jgi:hypothetical protein
VGLLQVSDEEPDFALVSPDRTGASGARDQLEIALGNAIELGGSAFHPI